MANPKDILGIDRTSCLKGLRRPIVHTNFLETLNVQLMLSAASNDPHRFEGSVTADFESSGLLDEKFDDSVNFYANTSRESSGDVGHLFYIETLKATRRLKAPHRHQPGVLPMLHRGNKPRPFWP